jgi:methylase of polypeptide subunit release factors
MYNYEMDGILLKRFSKNSLEQNKRIRQDPKLAEEIFKINFKIESLQEYYFWDNTTVSMKSPLLIFVDDGLKVLEIGTGPSSTLSRFLAKHKSNLNITATDISKNFLRTASMYSSGPETNSIIKYVHTNLTSGLYDKFDLIFMNPPYVSSTDLNSIGIYEGSAEYQAGFGGLDGGAIITEFLKHCPKVLEENGTVILGINNRYFPDLEVIKLIELSEFYLLRRYYKKNQVPPFSQVYIMKKK